METHTDKDNQGRNIYNIYKRVLIHLLSYWDKLDVISWGFYHVCSQNHVRQSHSGPGPLEATAPGRATQKKLIKDIKFPNEQH